MNNFKSCVPCVCTGSGRKWVCEEHNIGTQCGTTATNTATETVGNSDVINIQQNQQNSQKLIRQLEVVPSPAEVCQNDPVGYQTAAFVPSKVPRWRRPPYLNILMLRDEHHITPHMTKVNVMAKLNTVPESILSEIEEYLDIWTLKVKNRGPVKIDSRRNFDILRILNSKSKSGFLTLNIDFQEIVFFTENVIFHLKCSYF